MIHFFTDLPDNYHRATDDWERINADGIADVASLAADLVRTPGRAARAADLRGRAPAGARSPRAAATARPSAPSPTWRASPAASCCRASARGSAAETAGIRAGDVLVGMGEYTIANLQDFQNALSHFKAGDHVDVRVRRGTETLTLPVTLGGR